jgi:hypothetical protein
LRIDFKLSEIYLSQGNQKGEAHRSLEMIGLTNHLVEQPFGSIQNLKTLIARGNQQVGLFDDPST